MVPQVKSRLVIVGSSECKGWETVHNTFSPTVVFSTVRLLISLVVDPKFSVESYDLSGAFLGTDLRDRTVYIRVPKDDGVHAGKILVLKLNRKCPRMANTRCISLRN